MNDVKQCDHEWKLSAFVIDTLPPTYSWHCQKCEEVTHDRSTSKLCDIGHVGQPSKPNRKMEELS